MSETISINNNILKLLIESNLSSTQYKIVLAIIIYTNENGSKEFSRSFLASLINRSQRFISKELKKLFESKILLETIKPDYVNARVINLNKNFSEWEVCKLKEVG